MAEEAIEAKRTCTKCGVEYPRSPEFFFRCAKVSCGLKAVCKTCCLVSNNIRRRKNYAVDPSEMLARSKRWRDANRETVNERERERKRWRKYKRPEGYKSRWEAANRDHVRRMKRVIDARRRARILKAEGDHNYSDVERIYDEQGGTCFYCGCELKETFQADHFIPLARGGGNGAGNIRVSCAPCNASKGPKMPWEWMPGRFTQEEFASEDILP